MSTFLAKPNEVERNWYVIDAAGKSLGRVAAQAATLLRGKNKATFTPSVVVSSAAESPCSVSMQV